MKLQTEIVHVRKDAEHTQVGDKLITYGPVDFYTAEGGEYACLYDAMASHAMKQAIREFHAAPLDSSLTFPEDAIKWLEWRADEIMREWGMEVTP